eukprot:GHVU01231471.1.p1 GENE.GHVU01231471.1~~GHVU01231471.1.p1  ORF type:complete len:109 (-),score=8.18 GHVU01231471.1:247-573(-)
MLIGPLALKSVNTATYVGSSRQTGSIESFEEWMGELTDEWRGSRVSPSRPVMISSPPRKSFIHSFIRLFINYSAAGTCGPEKETRGKANGGGRGSECGSSLFLTYSID